MERADLDWKNLGFGLTPTDYSVRYRWRDGQWSEPEVSQSMEVNLSVAATVLHYGQALFEGLKAFETVDGRCVLFRPEMNAKRMIHGARKLLMQSPSEDMFVNAAKEVVRLNRRFVPPVDSGASLYVRPLLIGTGARVGVRPSDEYMFILFVTPCGPYFKHGLRPIRLRVEEEVHRAAPLGVGDIKAAGNYAAGMRATHMAREQGYNDVLYLDAREGRYVDESGPANFFGIRHQGDSATYVTPRSLSILPSVTNDSLTALARDMGMVVERRPIGVDELPSFDEAGCCGTATVIAPVGTIQWRGQTIQYNGDGTEPGPWTLKLYNQLTSIQRGKSPDTHGWLDEI
jgi:branched-chain amino acid aminotransferase